MTSDGGGGGPNPWIRPRIIIAGVLTFILVYLLWADAHDPAYSLSELTLTLLLGGILTLVGIEVNDWLRGGKP